MFPRTKSHAKESPSASVRKKQQPFCICTLLNALQFDKHCSALISTAPSSKSTLLRPPHRISCCSGSHGRSGGGGGNAGGLGGAIGGSGGEGRKSSSSVSRTLAGKFIVPSNRFKLGSTLVIWSASMPNHCARPIHTPSHGVVGISLPLPIFNSLSVASDAGNLPKIFPPLTSPPSRTWLPPHAWSVPCPFEVSVLPKSDDVRTATSFQLPFACISLMNESSAELTVVSASCVSCGSLCASKPPLRTKNTARSTPASRAAMIDAAVF